MRKPYIGMTLELQAKGPNEEYFGTLNRIQLAELPGESERDAYDRVVGELKLKQQNWHTVYPDNAFRIV